MPTMTGTQITFFEHSCLIPQDETVSPVQCESECSRYGRGQVDGLVGSPSGGEQLQGVFGKDQIGNRRKWKYFRASLFLPPFRRPPPPSSPPATSALHPHPSPPQPSDGECWGGHRTPVQNTESPIHIRPEPHRGSQNVYKTKSLRSLFLITKWRSV